MFVDMLDYPISFHISMVNADYCVIVKKNQRHFVLFQIEPDYTSEEVSISNYPLSAALTCAKLCGAFEERWGIV